MTLLLLTSSTLTACPSDVLPPRYARSAVRQGIVHLGLGAFHRAHQALYTEAALTAGDLRWGITGVHLRGRAMADILNRQAGLYSVTERHGKQAQTRVVGAVREALYAPSQLDRVLDAIADPAVAILTSTVTEKGYSLNPATQDLDLHDPDIQHDLATPRQPRSTLGVLLEGLRRRAPTAPLTLLCCDNMAANGRTLRKLLLQYAGEVDPNLARRIEATIAFPNTMVDRIVPAATPDSLDLAQTRLGVRDEAAIVCEPFTQWVIEDQFAGPRPEWERGGALFTRDVLPFQAMKLRLLNGSHSAIAYLGQLLGLATVSEVMADAALAAFVRTLMLQDLRASTQVPDGYDAHAYCEELLHRFENPALGHKTQQIAMDGTQKVPVRWLPTLRESMAQGLERPALERALAAWLHYLACGSNEQGQALVISDPGATALIKLLRGASDPAAAIAAALSHTPVFGQMPWPDALQQRLTRHLHTLQQAGVRALLASLPND